MTDIFFQGCNAIDVRGKCQRDGGPHWMILEAAKYTATSHGKKWHPSAGMHLLRGEIIAYRYSYILLDAIYTIRDEQISESSNKLRGRLKDRLNELQPDMGSLPPSHCNEICRYRPKCFTGVYYIDYMTPTYVCDYFCDLKLCFIHRLISNFFNIVTCTCLPKNP